MILWIYLLHSLVINLVMHAIIYLLASVSDFMKIKAC